MLVSPFILNLLKKAGRYMLYSTHLFFSKIFYENMLYANCVKIKKINFKFGNIKPDLMLNFKDIPHNYCSSSRYIISEIESLIEGTLRIEDLQSKDFAVRLGIIDHYISDFFCMPHNRNLVKKSLISHLVYEKRIDSICKKINICMLKKFLYDKELEIGPENSVSEFFHLRYNNYRNEAFSVTNDILYAIQTCTIVNNYIIKSCIKKISLAAA